MAYWVSVVLTHQKGGKRNRKYKISYETTCYMLKKMISRSIGVSASRLHLTHRDRAMNDATRVLVYTGKNQVPVHCSIAQQVSVGSHGGGHRKIRGHQ